MNSSSYDILVLVESNLNCDFLDSELECSNFNLFRKDRSSLTSHKTSGGGILVYVRKSIRSSRMSISHQNVEQLFILCEYKGSKFIIAGLYIPPNMPDIYYSLHCETVESVMQNSSHKIYIFGDYNLPEANWSNDVFGVTVACPGASSAVSVARTFGFLQLYQKIDIPNTRNVFLDLLFTNDNSVVISLASDPILDDSLHHLQYECLLSNFYSKESSGNNLFFEDFYYDFRNANFVGLNDYLAGVDWAQCLTQCDDVNNAVDIFYEILGVGIASFVPVRKYINSTYPKWFSAELKQITYQKRSAHKCYVQSRSPNDYTEFSRLRSECKRLRKECWSLYIQRVDNEFKTNPKYFWTFMRELKSNHSLPHNMTYGDEVAESGQNIVSLFKNYFQSVFTPASRGNLVFDMPINLSENFSLSSVSRSDIFNKIAHLPNKVTLGPDGIPNIVLKQCIFTLVVPLHLLFNKSLSSSTFPSGWKHSYIIPIFKSGDKHLVTNYRGVCIQSSIPKLLDSLVSDQLKWMCRNLINVNQHGFSAGRSTVTNLLTYQNKLTRALEDFKQVDSIYTDFSKAFDQVDHLTFLHRLYSLGFDTAFVQWVQSFLSDQQQRVRIGSFQSDPINVTSGVPQGGHCSPLFFILFMNSIFECFQNSDGLAFADDLKVSKVINSLNDQLLLQADLDRLAEWCQSFKLNLNISKCCHISFFKGSKKFDTSYSINGKNLKYVSKIKDLGVIFQEDLSFVEHIISITVQSSKMLGFILRNCHINFSVDTLKGLYYSLVRSKLEYGSVVWSPYQAVYIATLERTQHRFLRYCAFKLGVVIVDHEYKHIERILNIPTLSDRRIYAGLTFIFNLVNANIDCADLLEYLSIYISTRNSRQDFVSFSIPFHRTNYGYFSPLDRYTRLINNSHMEIFGISLSKFKGQFKNVTF